MWKTKLGVRLIEKQKLKRRNEGQTLHWPHDSAHALAGDGVPALWLMHRDALVSSSCSMPSCHISLSLSLSLWAKVQSKMVVYSWKYLKLKQPKKRNRDTHWQPKKKIEQTHVRPNLTLQKLGAFMIQSDNWAQLRLIFYFIHLFFFFFFIESIFWKMNLSWFLFGCNV